MEISPTSAGRGWVLGDLSRAIAGPGMWAARHGGLRRERFEEVRDLASEYLKSSAMNGVRNNSREFDVVCVCLKMTEHVLMLLGKEGGERD